MLSSVLSFSTDGLRLSAAFSPSWKKLSEARKRGACLEAELRGREQQLKARPFDLNGKKHTQVE